MEDFKYSKNIGVDYYAADNKMNINFWALMAYFQDIAIEHSDSAGYTVKKLFDNDLGWVIPNYHVIVDRLPVYGEKITLKARATSIKHFQAERSYTVTDENVNDIVRATSKWVLMNLKKRSPESIPQEMNTAYRTGAAPAIENEKFRMTKERGELIWAFDTVVTRSQTDTNGHTNNTQYAAWAWDMVPDHIYDGFNCHDFKIVFKKESRKGDEITAKTYKRDLDGETEIITDFFITGDEKPICSAESLWKKQ